MIRFKKIYFIFCLILILFTISCKNKNTETIISINASNITFNIDDVNIELLKLNINYSNNNTKTISVTKDMISNSDFNDLKNIGIHKVKISYKDFECFSYINIKSKDNFCVFIYNDEELIYSESFTESISNLDVLKNTYEKEGYNFLGFINYNGECVNYNTNINENMYIYANYERISYTIKFIVDDELYKTINVYHGDTIIEIPTPSKDGYIFMGWSIELNNLIITEDLEVYAKFNSSSNSVKVRLFVNDEIYKEFNIKYGEYIESVEDPYLEGYEFVYWDSAISVQFFKDTDIHAIFKEIKTDLDVKFIVDGVLFSKQIIKYGNIIENIPANPIKEGYEFIGWDYDFNNPVIEDLNINAIFEEKLFTVKYFALENEYVSYKVKFGSYIPVPSDYPSIEGYTFIDWDYDLNTFVEEDIIINGIFEIDINKAYEYIKDDYECLLYSNDISYYKKYGFSGYTLKYNDYVLFLTNVIEIYDLENDDLSPSIHGKNSGVLYVNKTGKTIRVNLNDTLAVLKNTYYTLICNESGTVSRIVNTNNNVEVTIPYNGYMWCPGYNDGDVSGNGLTVSMRELSNANFINITNWNEQIEVDFYNNLGDYIDSVSVYPGNDIKYPEVKEIKDYYFHSWNSVGKKIFYNCTIEAFYVSTIIQDYKIDVINGSGEGIYKTGDEVTVIARTKVNYTFAYWTSFGKKVSNDRSYTFICTKDDTLVAHYIETSKLVNLEVNGNTIYYRNSSLIVQTPNNLVDNYCEMRAAWVSPITDCVDSFKNETQYKQNITEMLDVLEYYNFNTVVFHIRIYNDALYLSKLNPKSIYLNTDLDILSWVIDECHKRGIEFHAWLNPYRVKASSNKDSAQTIANGIKKLCPNNIGSNPNYLLCGKNGGCILNPGLPEVRQFIVDTCMEIIENYDVDAIHFDDYFYIENVDDTSTRASYNSENLSINDFRRKQVDLFIELLSNTIRKYNKEHNRFVQLGISPSGIYRNGDGNVTYDELGNAISTGSNTGGMEHYDGYLFSDTVNWINHEWIDYITPQSYWAFTHKTAGYANVMDWWNEIVRHKNVKLYSGIGIYMAESGGNYSWGTNSSELLQQLTYLTKLDNVSGSCWFKFEFLRQYYLNKANNIMTNMFDTFFPSAWNNKALCPEITSCNDPLYLGPVGNLSITLDENKVSIKFLSISDARKYVVFRSDGELMFDSSEIVDIVGMQDGEITVEDTLDYSSTYTYTVYAISGSNTLGMAKSANITYK